MRKFFMYIARDSKMVNPTVGYSVHEWWEGSNILNFLFDKIVFTLFNKIKDQHFFI